MSKYSPGVFSRRQALALGLGVSAAALVGCSGGKDAPSPTRSIDPNVNLTGLPIVKQPTTIKFMTAKGLPAADDFNEVANWKKYQEMTNVSIDWGLVPQANIKEKVTLALASGNYPEVLYGSELTSNEITRYGSEQALVPFNDLIESYMPNLKKILDAMPDIRAGMTFPDGNIYGLPTIFDPDFKGLTYAQRLWVRQDWLDQLGMQAPTTTEDLYSFLKQSKEQGLGSTSPMGDPLGATSLEYFLSGAFGVSNKGVQQPLIDQDPETNDVRFYRTSESYKELLQFMHRLYDEGLLAADVFSKDFGAYTNEVAGGAYAAVITIDPTTIFGGATDQFVSTRMLQGPSGARSYNFMRSPLFGVNNFLMTDKNEHQVETARWIDYFYGEEGRRLFFLGIEGTSYEKQADGSYDFLPDIKDGAGEFSARVRPYVTFLGAGYPGIVTQATFKGAEGNERSRVAAELLAPDALDDCWPEFTYTVEEAERIKPFLTDANVYYAESRADFITGKRSFSDWTAYAAEFDQMGLEEYMDIQRAALQRFEEAK